jgi:hypothetical protein
LWYNIFEVKRKETKRNMQFAVPQFTDVEDKLIGPFTLKQFLFIGATGGIVLFFYSLLHLSIFFFVFAIPVAGIGLYLTFGRFNGRPVYGYLGAFINYLTRPQARIFKREEPNVVISIKKNEPAVSNQVSLDEPPDSRLKKLAYLLDQKTEEEKNLIDTNG